MEAATMGGDAHFDFYGSMRSPLDLESELDGS
jgi:hypothetical protein